MVLIENIMNSARDLWNIEYLETRREDNTVRPLLSGYLGTLKSGRLIEVPYKLHDFIVSI